jgi:hypothetical protein
MVEPARSHSIAGKNCCAFHDRRLENCKLFHLQSTMALFHSVSVFVLTRAIYSQLRAHQQAAAARQLILGVACAEVHLQGARALSCQR